MNSYKAIEKAYQKKQDEFLIQKEAIEKKIYRLQAKLKKLEDERPHWIDDELIPLAKELMKRLNMKYYQIYGPFGMNCETTVYMSNKRVGPLEDSRFPDESDIEITKVKTLSLTVNGNMQYYTGINTEKYAEGTIGYYNGFNHVYAPLPDSIDEIAKEVRRIDRKLRKAK